MSDPVVTSSERSSRVSLSLTSARRGAAAVVHGNGFSLKHAPADVNGPLSYDYIVFI